MQGNDGYLWLGTYNGLVRFDGVRYVVFDSQNTPELADNRITALYQDDDGGLWIGHETGELTRCLNGQFERVNMAQQGRQRTYPGDG